MSPKMGYRKPAPAESRIVRIGIINPALDKEFEIDDEKTRSTCRNTLEFSVVRKRILRLGNAN